MLSGDLPGLRQFGDNPLSPPNLYRPFVIDAGEALRTEQALPV